MERLHQFRPDLINWVIQQTQSEADRRWKRQTRVDWFVLVERIGGLILGFLIAALGLGAAMYLAMNNHETTASVVGGGTLVGIVTALVRGRRAKPQEPSPLPAQPQKKKKN